MSEVPYIGFGNDTLNTQPRVEAGDEIDCPKCEGRHKLEWGTDGPNPIGLMFYKCGDKSYLGAMQHRLVVGVPADVSGSIGSLEDE